MVVPYQIWMLQRLEDVIARCASRAAGRDAVAALLARFGRGDELLGLGELLAGCRVRKEGARLYAA